MHVPRPGILDVREIEVGSDPLDPRSRPGDMDGEARWYEWSGKGWKAHALRHVLHGHTCEIRDINADGNPDIFIGDYNSKGGQHNANGTNSVGSGIGRAFVFSGADGSILHRIEGAEFGDGMGPGRGVEDVDGDGRMLMMRPTGVPGAMSP